VADFDYDGPDTTPELVRPFIDTERPRRPRTALGRARVAEPVLYRLIGHPDDVAAHLDLLAQVMELTTVTDPIPARGGKVRVYATGHRAYPYMGGPK